MNWKKKAVLSAVAVLCCGASFLFVSGCARCSCGKEDAAGEQGYIKLKPPQQEYTKNFIRTITVKQVLDGRTVLLDDGEKVRMIGIETPAEGDDFWLEGLNLTKSLVEGKKVSMMVCPEKPFDWDGATLAHVFLGPDTAATAAEKLIEEGYARVRIMPPCGAEKITFYNRLMLEARSKLKGLWRAEVRQERQKILEEQKKNDYLLRKWREAAERGRKQHLEKVKKSEGFGLVPLRKAVEKKKQ